MPKPILDGLTEELIQRFQRASDDLDLIEIEHLTFDYRHLIIEALKIAHNHKREMELMLAEREDK